MPAPRRITEDSGRRNSYTIPPTYKDPPPPNTPPGYVPPADNVTAPGPSIGGAPAMGISGIETGGSIIDVAARQPVPQDVDPSANGGLIGSGINPVPQKPGSNYDDMLSQYLGSVFGGGRSFAPVEKQITGERDDALRSMAEKMASRGLGNSGAMSMGAGDIYGKSADQLASSYQDWRSGGIKEMQSALSPFIEEANAEKLMGLSTEQKKELMDKQLDNIMKQMFGANYDPNQGTAPFEFMAGMAGKGEPDKDMQAAIEKWIKNNPNLKDLFDQTDPYGTYHNYG